MQLVVQSGAEPGRTYDLRPGKLSLGRQSVNDVVISDEQASRRHADLEVTANGLLVTDNNSANGTFVNGTRVSSPQLLKPGDTLQIGTTVLKLVDGQSGASTIPSGYEQPAPPALAQDFNAPYSPPAAAPQSAYGAPAAPAADYSVYGQAAPPAQPAYGGYEQPAQQQYGGYGQAAAQPAQPAYGGYEQPAQQQYGGYGQAAQPSQPAYGGYDQPQQYGVPPYGAAAAPAKKGKMGLLIGIIGAVVVIGIVAVVLFVFVLGGGGGSGLGDLPAPNNSEKLTVSDADQSVLQNSTGFPKGGKFAYYKTSEKPDALKTFYEGKMKDKGWTASPGNILASGTLLLVFIKGTDGAEVVAATPTKDSDIQDLEKGAPSLKGKLKVGDTLVILVTANAKDFAGS
ncbi:MAG: FHA domain-containing protein [Chloroflexi bacterium]|uniref:FHA domain-containing protein n=1 Tax=Candidatus Chlorohelix allophototropha TaxID=3003348 RepID=A0A8T7LSU5_9CHLR|nr:FHA domain-containing protein [Chloroflexota bacterium]WJW66978.1 FHA domain-containing protein [Chloroflexota bacterium L227-S17]